MKKIVPILIVLTALGLWFWLFFASSPQPADRPLWQTASSTTNFSQVTEASTDLNTYRNSRYRFKLNFPSALNHREYDEGNGAMTIIFEDPTNNYGFQIFVVPYDLTYVSAERIKRDLPSGVVENQFEVKIGGAVGAIFASQNPVMGKTREVWFIKDGYLYEVTTYLELDPWLSQIMATWQWL